MPWFKFTNCEYSYQGPGKVLKYGRAEWVVALEPDWDQVAPCITPHGGPDNLGSPVEMVPLPDLAEDFGPWPGIECFAYKRQGQEEFPNQGLYRFYPAGRP
jgi:hypothetical protein